MTQYKTLLSNPELPYLVELYEFYFKNQEILLTNHKDLLQIPNYKTFQPAIIERKDIEINSQGEITTDIIIYTGTEFLKTLITTDIPQIKIKISLYFLEQNLLKTLFHGICKDLNITESGLVSLKAVDFLSLSKINIPRLVYSTYCNNTFGDEFCKIPISQYTVLTEVEERDQGKCLVAPILSQYPNDFFTFGYVEYLGPEGTFYRLIVKHVASEGAIYLHMPLTVSVHKKTVRIVAGCDKTPATCKNKFNNIQNFTGFPYIPAKNPTIWGIL